MDEQNSMELESKTMMHDEPQDTEGSGDEGAKQKKRMTPLKIVLIVFCALVGVGLGVVGCIFGRVMIIQGAGYRVMDDGLVLVSTKSSDIEEDGSFTVPEKYFGSPVIAIGESAFEGQTTLKSVSLPDTVKHIDYGAFRGCYSLESIRLSSSLEEIDEDAFFACQSLKQIRIPEGTVSISNDAFAQCEGLELVYLPSTLTHLGGGVFRECDSLKAFVMEKESPVFFVSEEGDLYRRDPMTLVRYAPAKDVTRFVLDRNITHIRAYAFDGCTKLESVKLHFDVFHVESSAFARCPDTTIFIEGYQSTERPWSAGWNDCGCLVFWGASSEEDDNNDDNNGTKPPSSDESSYSEGLTFTLSEDGSYYILSGMGSCTDIALNIPPTYNDLPVKEIGAGFGGSEHLISITIPEHMTEIFGMAFSGCQKIVEIINLSSMQISVPSSDAAECGGAESYAFEVHSGKSKICYLGDFAFYSYADTNYLLAYKGDASTLSLPESYQGEKYEIYTLAFYDCDTLMQLSVPDAVSAIGKLAFANCSSLTEAKLPDSVEQIGSWAFARCTALRTFTVPSSVHTVGAFAFDGCASLRTVTLPSSVSTVGDSAFRSCPELGIYCEAQSQPTSWNTYWNSDLCPVVWGCASPDESSTYLTYSYDDTTMTATVTGYTGSMSYVTIPTFVDGHVVTAIGAYAFDSTPLLIGITLTPSVTSIGKNAFSYCQNLSEIKLGKSLVSIGEDAFAGCTSLTNITLPSPLQSIGASAFYECTALQSVLFGDSLVSIGEQAFSGCTALSSIAIPSSVSSLGNKAFFGCTALTSIHIDATLSDEYDLTSAVFSGAGQSTDGLHIVIGKNARTVAPYLFSGYNDTQPYALNAVSISFEAESACAIIGEYAFANCQKITAIELPASVVSVPVSAFENCTALAQINMEAENGAFSSYEGNLYTNDLTTLIIYAPGKDAVAFEVPSTVTAINTGAFYRHPYLQSVTIGESVTTVGDRAFYGCSVLSSVSFSNSLRSIGSYAFADCPHINAVTVPDSVFELGRCAFGGSASLIIYCQAESQPATWDAAWNEHNYPVFFDVDESFVFPDESSAFLSYAFSDSDKTAAVTGYTGDFTSVTIPAYVNGYAVRTIRSGAFANCSRLVSITLPDTLTTIEHAAFVQCYRLVEIINHSELSLTSGHSTHGAIAEYAKRIHAEKTQIVDQDGFLFLSVGTVHYLVSYVGEQTSLAFPSDYNGEPYTIMADALRGMTQLRSVTLPATVTEIGDRAFLECTGLLVITANGVTDLGHSALSGCESLTDVLLGSVTSISAQAFSYCGKLANVSLGTALGSIGESAFVGCRSLSKITLPASLLSIGKNAFAECALTSITLPDAITELSYGIFYNCTALQSVSLSPALTKIGQWAFKGCTSLLTLNLPDTLRSVGTLAFDGCGLVEKVGALSYVGAWVIDCDGAATEVTIREGTLGIAHGAFQDCASIRSITLPEGVHTVGDNAFYRCSQLAIVKLPSTLSQIGFYAFGYCGALESLLIPASVTTLGELAFDACNSLTIYAKATEAGADWYDNYNPLARPVIFGVDDSFVFPDESSAELSYTFDDTTMSASVTGYTGNRTHVTVPTKVNGYTVTAIGDTAFANRKNLTGVTLPDTITTIGASAFVGCPNLVSITLPTPLQSIGNYAFGGCESLVEVINHSSLHVVAGYESLGNVARYAMEVHRGESKIVRLGDYLFYTNAGTNYLLSYAGYDTVLTLPESYYGESYEIYRFAFAELSAIERVSVPDTVTAIGQSAFTNCYALTSVTLGDAITSIGDTAFAACSMLSEINLPRALQTIGENAFWACTITEITLPDGVREIGEYAFSSCRKLTSVTLNDSLSKIGAFAFQDCSTLTKIVIPESVGTVGAYAFDGCSSLYIYCELESQPSTYHSTFNPQNRPIVWGVDSSFVYPDESSAYLSYDFYDTEMQAVVNAYTGDLTHVTIPSVVDGYTVIKIKQSAFRYNTNIVSITIPDTLTTIENASFEGCTSLRSVRMSRSLKLLGSNAFTGCTSLESITLPETLTVIEFYAFQGCSALTSIALPGALSQIKEGAFRDCTSLNSVTLNPTLSQIGSYAFFGCTSLAQIVIPESVSTMGTNPFGGCTNLTVLCEAESQPEGFGANWNLSKIPVIWGYIAPDESSAFLTYSYDDTTMTATVTGYTGELSHVTIPSVVDRYLVTSIGSDAFYNCDSLTSITIPDSVTEIGDYAFYWCNSLTSVSIPNSVTEIGNSAFGYCSKLTSVTIPDSVTSIGSDAFYNCSGLTIYCEAESQPSEWNSNWNDSNCPVVWGAILPDESSAFLTYSYNDATMTAMVASYTGTYTVVTIPTMVDGYVVTSIGDYTFYKCTNLTSVTIPDSVTAIGWHAFYSCDDLTSITIPDSVTEIGSLAFYNCTSLTSVMIGDSVTKIGSSAFAYCDSLMSITVNINNAQYQSIDGNLYSKDGKTLIQYAIGKTDTSFAIPDSVTLIGNYAFSSCTSLTSVTIGNSVTSIGEFAFTSCDSLTSVVIPDSVTSIGNYAFEYCSSLTSVTIGHSVTSIGYYAFYGCDSLTSVTIPDSVTEIGDSAFQNCSNLTSVTMPDSVTEIGEWAFYNCSNLTIYCEAESQPSGWSSDWNPSSCPVVWGVIPPDESSAFLTYSYDDTTMTATVTGYTGTIPYVTIPSRVGNYTVTAIADLAFERNYTIRSVTLPGSVSEIGSYAFRDCQNLVEVINHSQISITAGGTAGGRVAYNALEVHTQASKIVNQNDYLFYSLNGKNYLIGYVGADTSLTLPESYRGASYEILSYAFYKNTTLTEITLSDEVRAIGKNAFSNCTALRSITLPASLESISYGMLASCSSLESITIPESVSFIDAYAFYQCTSLSTVDIPDAVMSVGVYAFDGCTKLMTKQDGISYVDGWAVSADQSLTSATVCEGTVGIASQVFTDLNPVTSVSLPSTLRAIGVMAFSHCKTLTEITIPDSVVYIGNDAFEYCSNLSTAKLSNSLEYIGDYAFEFCALNAISLPDTLSHMGFKPFNGCLSLPYNTYDNAFYLGNDINQYLYLIQSRGTTFTSCTIHEQTRFIEATAFEGCTALTSITIPDSVLQINNYAFSGCSNLSEVILGRSLKRIGMGAFINCAKLTELTIPDSVEEIGPNAFRGCTSLTILCELDSRPRGWDIAWCDECTVVWGNKLS